MRKVVRAARREVEITEAWRNGRNECDDKRSKLEYRKECEEKKGGKERGKRDRLFSVKHKLELQERTK